MTIESLLTDPRLKDVVIIAITLLGTSIAIKWATYIIKRTGNKWDVDVTLIQVLHEIIKYTIYAIAIIIILNVLGINITAIAVSLGVVGIAVGFAARDTLSNFISGLFILADKSFRVGDIIEVSNQKGKVSKMGFRLTTLITYDKKIITIPNSLFSTGTFINYTSSDIRRVDLDITIPHEMELEEILKTLEDMASGCEWVLKKPKPKVIIKELSDVGVKSMLCVWINDPWKITEHKSLLAKEANKLLKGYEP